MMVFKISPKRSVHYAYRMGFDCGLNGPNPTNSNFTIFSTPENTAEWERGKRDAQITKARVSHDSR